MALAHDVDGTGPAVVLLHSSAADRRMWDPQVGALLAAGHRVLRCDFRGFGDTPPARGYHDAEDVRDLLDYLGIEVAALVGASFGGRISQEIAARWPARVNRLVLLCAGMVDAEPSPELLAFAEREEELLAAGDIDAAVELNVRTWLGPDADERAREAIRVMRRHSFAVQAAFDGGPDAPRGPIDVTTIQAPTLVVSGAHDVRDFRDIAAVLAREIPKARHVELPWAGHLPNLERPAEVTALLIDFLGSAA
ncbi:alpha/beta fold hydrolase [Planosporangium sp. 12N6]|uniref:alpha/beta fold hydrolase n=1 Tax=Planosporangium spinosum TaxID=3402278 RepID=UPI003CE6E1AE